MDKCKLANKTLYRVYFADRNHIDTEDDVFQAMAKDTDWINVKDFYYGNRLTFINLINVTRIVQLKHDENGGQIHD